jgi:hypothetical protein
MQKPELGGRKKRRFCFIFASKRNMLHAISMRILSHFCLEMLMDSALSLYEKQLLFDQNASLRYFSAFAKTHGLPQQEHAPFWPTTSYWAFA